MSQRYAGSPPIGRTAARTTGPTTTARSTTFAGIHSGSRLRAAPIATPAPQMRSWTADRPKAIGSERTAFSGTSTRPRSFTPRTAR